MDRAATIGARGDRFVAAALMLGGGAIALVAMASPLAIAPLFGLVAVVGVAARGPAMRVVAWPCAGTLAFAVALGWAGASALWAHEPGLVPRLWTSIALAAAAGIALIAATGPLDAPARARIVRAMTIGLVVALVILTIEAIPRYLGLRPTPQQWLVMQFRPRFDASSLNRATTVIAIAVWIPAAALARRHGWRVAILLPLWAATITPAFESLAAVMALVAGGGAALLASWNPRRARVALSGAIVAGFTLIVLVPRWALFQRVFADRARDGSIWHRAEIWAFVTDRIAEHPVLGWGLNAARAIPGGKDQIQPGIEKLPLHPHNALLQLWLELGAVGATIGAVIALLIVRAATDPAHDAATRIGMTAAAGAALMVAGTAYGLWQGWWMATLWLIAALARATAMPARG
ncbi:MAG: O-antigen ligase family protein [Alphaproteobacteria bacterium]|nr:O-antigen ligase family protein [Alphaproteobacteria bacterium]